MDNCYFCDKKVLKEGYLLSCTSHCFKKCHLHCFRHYENYLISLIGYPSYYSYEFKKELLWNSDFNLIKDRIPCSCNKSFKLHQDNPTSLFFYGTNYHFAQHELKKN
jgi:hypothetical protein